MCLRAAGRSFKSINIFFPIQGETFSVRQQWKVCFREWASCVDVSSAGGSYVCAAQCVLRLNQSQDFYSLTYICEYKYAHITFALDFLKLYCVTDPVLHGAHEQELHSNDHCYVLMDVNTLLFGH